MGGSAGQWAALHGSRRVGAGAGGVPCYWQSLGLLRRAGENIHR
jgi:hypothetical protein